MSIWVASYNISSVIAIEFKENEPSDYSQALIENNAVVQPILSLDTNHMSQRLNMRRAISWS